MTGDVAVRRALRDLEHTRTAVRFGYFTVVAALIPLTLTVWGWIAAISWGLDGAGHPGVDKGNAMSGFVAGLVLASCASLALAGSAGLFLVDSLVARRKAREHYEDEILDGAA